MRLVLLVSAASFVAAAATFACSAAQPPAADNSQNDTSAADPAPAPAPVAPAPAAPVDTDAAAVATTLPDGGLVTPVPIGTIPVTPIPVTTLSQLCLVDSISETEPNNDITTANMIPAVSSTFCGHVDPGDVDYISFTMPATIASFGFGLEDATGQPNIQPFVNGQPIAFGGNTRLSPGMVYTLQITSADGQPMDYRFRFNFSSF